VQGRGSPSSRPSSDIGAWEEGNDWHQQARVGDAPAFAYAYLWSWGGKEVEADGKSVVLDSAATPESVKFMVGFWKDAHDEGGLAWEASNNNRAFLSVTCSATLNGASI
jgi:multiple sugar transport system substrate-binding protein